MIVLIGLVAAGVIAFALWPRSRTSTATASGDSETYRVDLTTSPRSGPVKTSVQVKRHDSGPVQLNEVVIDAVMPAMGHAMPQVVATRQNDRFEAHGELFTMGGLWDVSLRLADETVTVQIPVTEGQG
ncbi:FixH family protein [Kibdelosporangium persicum]|uniref:YtkA domain-containing protein n=1 Tax=Kibdelosporangium persicum TaxID=2698649 RepID=A0ABX2EVN9_9PSEU|nr:FixH family protein [Kibdelosporangium persicum]NRN63085.1 YtkA domain-containing protein [Kibdelosporangium persicum]